MNHRLTERDVLMRTKRIIEEDNELLLTAAVKAATTGHVLHGSAYTEAVNRIYRACDYDNANYGYEHFDQGTREAVLFDDYHVDDNQQERAISIVQKAIHIMETCEHTVKSKQFHGRNNLIVCCQCGDFWLEKPS